MLFRKNEGTKLSFFHKKGVSFLRKRCIMCQKDRNAERKRTKIAAVLIYGIIRSLERGWNGLEYIL